MMACCRWRQCSLSPATLLIVSVNDENVYSGRLNASELRAIPFSLGSDNRSRTEPDNSTTLLIDNALVSDRNSAIQAVNAMRADVGVTVAPAPSVLLLMLRGVPLLVGQRPKQSANRPCYMHLGSAGYK